MLAKSADQHCVVTDRANEIEFTPPKFSHRTNMFELKGGQGHWGLRLGSEGSTRPPVDADTHLEGVLDPSSTRPIASRWLDTVEMVRRGSRVPSRRPRKYPGLPTDNLRATTKYQGLSLGASCARLEALLSVGVGPRG